MSLDDPDPQRSQHQPAWRRAVPAALMALQGVVLVVLGVVLIVRTITGGQSDVGRSLTLAVLVLVFALGAGLIARALLRAQDGARTPTVVWGVFVVLIGVTLARGGAPALGIVVAVVGVATLAGGWTATSGGRGGDLRTR